MNKAYSKLHLMPYFHIPTQMYGARCIFCLNADTIKFDNDHHHPGIMVNIKQCTLHTQPNALFPSSRPKVWCTMFVLSQRWLNCKNNTDIVGCWHCWNSDCISRTIVAAIFSPFLPVVARKCVVDQPECADHRSCCCASWEPLVQCWPARSFSKWFRIISPCGNTFLDNSFDIDVRVA